MVKHYYERNYVDIKDEYTNYLLSKLTPLIYEGFVSLYKKSLKDEDRVNQEIKKNPTHQNPGAESIFREYLRDMKNLNSNMIRDETSQIRSASGIPELFDDLVKAVVKSHIVLLTYNASEKTSLLVMQKRHEQVDVEKFIHTCYMECAPVFYVMPQLLHQVKKTRNDNDKTRSEKLRDHERYNQYLLNRKESLEKIRRGIKNAIRSVAPMKEILAEYLKNDYIREEDNVGIGMGKGPGYTNLRSMLHRDGNGGNRSVLEDGEQELYDEYRRENHDDNNNNNNHHRQSLPMPYAQVLAQGKNKNEDEEDKDSGSDKKEKNKDDETSNTSTSQSEINAKHDENNIDLKKMIIGGDGEDGENGEKNSGSDGNNSYNVPENDEVKNVMIEFGTRKSAATKAFEKMLDDRVNINMR